MICCFISHAAEDDSQLRQDRHHRVVEGVFLEVHQPLVLVQHRLVGADIVAVEGLLVVHRAVLTCISGVAVHAEEP